MNTKELQRLTSLARTRALARLRAEYEERFQELQDEERLALGIPRAYRIQEGVCKNGHNIAEVGGRNSQGRCRQCHREASAQHYAAKKSS